MSRLPGERVPDVWFTGSGHALAPGYSVRQDLRFTYLVFEQEIVIRLSRHCNFCAVMLAQVHHMQIRLTQQGEQLARLMNASIRFQEAPDGSGPVV